MKIKEKLLGTGKFLKDFLLNHDPGTIKYVTNKTISIKFHTAFDLFPIYILPSLVLYRGQHNLVISFGILFFRLDIDLYFN